MKFYRMIFFIQLLFLTTSLMAQHPAQPGSESKQKLLTEFLSNLTFDPLYINNGMIKDDVYAPFNLWKSRLPKKLTISAPLNYNPQTNLENRKIKYLLHPSDSDRYYIYEPFDLSAKLDKPALSLLLYNKGIESTILNTNLYQPNF